MVAKKRKSKRVTLQKKYKIQKRTKEHHKKLKKGVLANKGKKLVDNRIPNAWPYKAELLKEIQVAREKMEFAKQKKMELKRESKKSAAERAFEDPKTFETQTPEVEAEEEVLEEEMEIHSSKNMGQNSRRAYLRELRKVVESADVILHVLDARDPLGTKSSAVEEMVLSNSRKRLVYVLNKADLVPRDVLAAWLTYLRCSQPTIPFKCNTQNQKEHLGRVSGKVSHHQESVLQTNSAVGAEELMGLLKNYCRVAGPDSSSSSTSKSVISVGIVGFPNVGKSSLINSLTRLRSVGVSPTPGFTRVSQEVILDKNIRLIDSPGIVFADGDSTATALRNCVNVEELEDVLTPITAILEKCPQGYLMQIYSIPVFKPRDALGFLALVARSTGKLKKGGIPNTDAAARSVLHDWNMGRIKYYCTPPSKRPAVYGGGKAGAGGGGGGEERILSGFSKELSIEGLKDSDIRVLDALHLSDGPSPSSSIGIAMEGVGESIDLGHSLLELESTSNSKISSSSSSSSSTTTTSREEGEMEEAHNNSDEEKEHEEIEVKTMKKIEDLRKVQKKLKMKSVKILRRGGTEDYSFENDFSYSK